MEILVRNGANINEKNVKNISVGETDAVEKERERAKKERERGEREMSEGREKAERRSKGAWTERRRKNFFLSSFLSLPLPPSLSLSAEYWEKDRVKEKERERESEEEEDKISSNYSHLFGL